MTLRVGLVARGEQRGLGLLCAAFYRHMQPDRTLVVNMGKLSGGFAPDFDQYPDGLVVDFDGHELPEHIVRKWLKGLDVLYSAETFYDWRMVTWAHEAGIATVCHAMPEFVRHRSDPSLPAPTAFWNPTTWRMDLLPEGSPVVPVPVENDVWPLIPAGTGDRLQVVHVAGHRAAGDRNGTLQVLGAVRRMRGPIDLTIHCQDERLPVVRPPSNDVTLRLVPGGQKNRADLYAGAHLLLMPRRYGGLCMPAQEALGAGLALAMSQCPPNPATWPLVALRGQYESRQPTPSGDVRSFTCDPRYIASIVDGLARNPERVATLQTAGVAYAKAHSWSELAPVYRQRLAEACK